jgi:hypothetical protein
LEPGDVGLLTVDRLIRTLNGRLFSLWKKEYMGLGFKNCPEFFFIAEGSRVVLSLPPLACILLSLEPGAAATADLQQKTVELVWQHLGFLDLEQAPFQKPAASRRRGYALANFSPGRTRLYQADVSVDLTKPLYQPSAEENKTGEALARWKVLAELLDSKLLLFLGRVATVGEYEFDLDGVTTLRHAASNSDTPPTVSGLAMNAMLASAFAGFSLADKFDRLFYASDEDAAAGEDVSTGSDAAAVPTVSHALFPKLSIPQINRFASTNRLTLSVSAGPEATRLLGYAPNELSFSYDCGADYVSSKASSFLRAGPTDHPETGDWDDAQDGSEMYAMLYTRLLIAGRARDVAPNVTQPDKLQSRYLRGPLAEARKAAFIQASQTPDELAKLPEAVVAPCRSADSEENDLEYDGPADFLRLENDSAPRAWRTSMTLDEAKRVVPAVPSAWKIPNNREEWMAARKAAAEKALAEAEATRETLDAPVEEGAATTLVVAPPPPPPPPDEPTTTTTTTTSPLEPLLQLLQDVAGQRQLAEQLESQASALPETVVAPVPPPPPSPQPPPPQAAAVDPSPPSRVYPCYPYGTSNRTLQRLCPRTKEAGAKTDALPPLFHLTVEEGERRDWLGPLGLAAFAGTFKTSQAGGGESTRSNAVLLRGANQLKYLTFRLVDLGFDPYVAEENGLAFALCRLHPHRSGELSTALRHYPAPLPRQPFVL